MRARAQYAFAARPATESGHACLISLTIPERPSLVLRKSSVQSASKAEYIGRSFVISPLGCCSMSLGGSLFFGVPPDFPIVAGH